jgi:hypothetical protein
MPFPRASFLLAMVALCLVSSAPATSFASGRGKSSAGKQAARRSGKTSSQKKSSEKNSLLQRAKHRLDRARFKLSPKRAFLKARRGVRAFRYKRSRIKFGSRNPIVPARVQRRTIKRIYANAKKVRARGEVPVVQIDLDLTALQPVERTVAALQHVAGRFGIRELEDPLSNFDTLPGYTTGAFQQWLDSSGLRKKYPDMDWGNFEIDGASAENPEGAVYNQFRHRYWRGNLARDRVAPGLVEFVHDFENNPDIRGKVLFNSGRNGEFRDVSLQALKAGGIENPTLYIGKIPGMTDAQVKTHRQAEFRSHGTTVAVIDDRAGNGNAVKRENPGALRVAAFAAGFSHEKANRRAHYRLSSFASAK